MAFNGKGRSLVVADISGLTLTTLTY